PGRVHGRRPRRAPRRLAPVRPDRVRGRPAPPPHGLLRPGLRTGHGDAPHCLPRRGTAEEPRRVPPGPHRGALGREPPRRGPPPPPRVPRRRRGAEPVGEDAHRGGVGHGRGERAGQPAEPRLEPQAPPDVLDTQRRRRDDGTGTREDCALEARGGGGGRGRGGRPRRREGREGRRGRRRRRRGREQRRGGRGVSLFVLFRSFCSCVFAPKDIFAKFAHTPPPTHDSVEIHMTSQSHFNVHDPGYIASVAASTDLSLLVTKDKNWPAAAVRCRTHPSEAAEALEVKVRGAYTARITPLHFACEHRPSAEVVSALVAACPSALERRQEPGGQLPLHAACTWGASGPAVHVMLDACPGAAERKDFLSNLPLHCACYSGGMAEEPPGERGRRHRAEAEPPQQEGGAGAPRGDDGEAPEEEEGGGAEQAVEKRDIGTGGTRDYPERPIEGMCGPENQLSLNLLPRQISAYDATDCFEQGYIGSHMHSYRRVKKNIPMAWIFLRRLYTRYHLHHLNNGMTESERMCSSSFSLATFLAI
ncbi:hypothetical protein THAOC_17984, partial [Thalassiosira oceanica]